MRVQKSVVFFSICTFLAALPTVTPAQQTSQSLADAARKIKEQQNQPPKPTKVWTNENLPTSAAVSVVGKAPEQQKNVSGAQPAAEAGTPDEEKLAQTQTGLEAAKKKLDSLKTDLDLAQRMYKLDSDQHYSMPDYGTDQQGQARLDADKSDVAAKQQAVDTAQKKVDDLQKEVDSLNEKLKTVGNPAKQ